MLTHVWIFNGASQPLPSGVFSTRAAADAWIAQHSLAGLLTAYPIDTGVYDWTVRQGHVSVDKPSRRIATFSSAYLEHYHYEDGKPAGGDQ
jgi:hypothetical protein